MSLSHPSTARLDKQRQTAARRFTRRLARTHYENFTVVSLLLPRSLRQHFYNIYAFCRHADDLADEIPDKALALQRLHEFRADLLSIYHGTPSHPIHIALRHTIQRFEIPPQPFLDLIDAFEQDQRVARYPTYTELLEYCRRSANPVGHLVLYLCGYRDRARQELSDFTCTALQLANFWQDVTPDLANRGRIYLPLEDLERFGVSEADLHARRTTPQFIDLMRFEVDRAADLFRRGQALVPLVHRRYRTDISLYGRGGMAILQAIRDIDYDVLHQRPTLSRWDKMKLFARAILRLP